jgi:hypothetical protein
MKFYNIFEKAIDFGSLRSRDNILSFSFKFVFYFLPSLLLGYFTDKLINNIKNREILGDNVIYYILLQTIIIIITLYTFIILFDKYISEIQKTISGSIFIVMYFGIQSNYINMTKEYLNLHF